MDPFSFWMGLQSSRFISEFCMCEIDQDMYNKVCELELKLEPLFSPKLSSELHMHQRHIITDQCITGLVTDLVQNVDTLTEYSSSPAYA